MGMSASALSKFGWVEKRGKVRKAWKRRWCMFRSDGALVYFKTSQDVAAPAWASARGAIGLTGASVSAVEADKDGKHGLAIAVSSSKRIYAIRCSSMPERDSWLAAIQGAIELASGAADGDDADGRDLAPDAESRLYSPVVFDSSGVHHPSLPDEAFDPHGAQKEAAARGRGDDPVLADDTWDAILDMA
ncbi:uncharacterized protein AMSG_11023 [Thecamonas trahens ATCC 50062]|uniref:PH domain-containing protein n=1 Tax=Thecamonas trahens ATCC 50062 TaxID=461836 RepID=A0A0L0DT09_THETB|nr:hypothetical protein AMSG_11023 [Thecamonas trahens ATCC 50062]KNC55367.1 hypothetical protein AMSG_11023 [Thecamonas trahens ATCC 50062]|eukprot:XP_013753001.1 hypothetical protein AMSG_11023 [Thecamonas trahens ATCC 50062]